MKLKSSPDVYVALTRCGTFMRRASGQHGFIKNPHLLHEKTRTQSVFQKWRHRFAKRREKFKNRHHKRMTNAEQWRQVGRKFHTDLQAKIKVDDLAMHARVPELFWPCAVHSFANVDPYMKPLGDYQLVMVAITETLLEPCAVLSIFACKTTRSTKETGIA